MDPLTLGIVALMGAAATIAGASEDVETDIGSESNPNSQVQLAPQMGHLHRFINKAVAGEPVAYGAWAGIAGTVALVLLQLHIMPILAITVGAAVGTLTLVVYAITSHMGRIVSQSQFQQPLFMDALLEAIGPIAGHGFIALFCLVGVCTLIVMPLGDGKALHTFSIPLLAVLWGITLGAIGSSTGDVHYGSESEYQHYPFGGGIPVANQGDITTKAELGAKNSIDVGNFCAKFGGPLTGVCFGLLVFFSFWTTAVFGLIGGLIAGLVIILLLLFINERLENFARTAYGPYKE
jgi:tetrahydromethanopterin S-methyltransferase subunit E